MRAESGRPLKRCGRVDACRSIRDRLVRTFSNREPICDCNSMEPFDADTVRSRSKRPLIQLNMNKSGLHGLECKTRDPYSLVNDSLLTKTHCRWYQMAPSMENLRDCCGHSERTTRASELSEEYANTSVVRPRHVVPCGRHYFIALSGGRLCALERVVREGVGSGFRSAPDNILSRRPLC